MSEWLHRPEATLSVSRGPVTVPIDEAVARHMSQVYWEWRSAFDRDPAASPLQHPDFVLAELDSAGTRSGALLLHDPSEQAFAILVPKSTRTSSAGGLGPGWTLHGYRLAGGRLLGAALSIEGQRRMLAAATHQVAQSAGDFLLIEDLEESTPLYDAVQHTATHGCQVFTTHEFQPRRYVDFPASAEVYWHSFSSRSLSKFRRNLKKLGRTRLDRVTRIDQVPDFLRTAHEISRQSWQSRQYGLRIRNDEGELHQLTALAEHGHLRSYLWWVNDHPAAFAICNQHAGLFRYEEIAYCAEYGQFSPGRTMLFQIVEDLLAYDSPCCLDFGGGDAEYKQQFSNRQSRSGTIWLVPPTWRARWSLSYLQLCRGARRAARTVIELSGLHTAARQWIRSGSVPDTKDSHQDAGNEPGPGNEHNKRTVARSNSRKGQS